MAKYILDLNEEQAKTIAQAYEFFARIKMGQFDEIPSLFLSNELVLPEVHLPSMATITISF